MEQDDVLEEVQSRLRHVVVKLHWLLVTAQQKALVYPISHKEEEGGEKVKDWHGARVEEGDSEDDQEV